MCSVHSDFGPLPTRLSTPQRKIYVLPGSRLLTLHCISVSTTDWLRGYVVTKLESSSRLIVSTKHRTMGDPPGAGRMTRKVTKSDPINAMAGVSLLAGSRALFVLALKYNTLAAVILNTVVWYVRVMHCYTYLWDGKLHCPLPERLMNRTRNSYSLSCSSPPTSKRIKELDWFLYSCRETRIVRRSRRG